MQDLTYIINWWLLFFIVGLISLPATVLIFSNFLDKGYAFAKTIGFLFISYAVFLMALVRIAPFSTVTIYFIFGVWAIANVYILLKTGVVKVIEKSYKHFLFSELLFTSGYLLWVYVRGHQPDINGLEKLMDF
jgi:uncharacterized membrane protein